MNKNLKIFSAIGIIIVLIAIGFLFLFRNNRTQPPKTPPATDNQPTAQSVAEKKVEDLALKNALNIYSSTKQQGMDFSDGPCLGIVAPDWVLDIAHDPRQPVDNLPENQCTEFREGKVHHFIELDPQGNLIQMH